MEFLLQILIYINNLVLIILQPIQYLKGLIYLTKWLASEMSPKIRVNSISLGGIKRYQKNIHKKVRKFYTLE